MTFVILVVYLAIYCVWGSVWGWAVNKVIENKGYRENWFWWGFFFGMIAMLVALTKPDLPKTEGDTNYKFSYGDKDNILGENYVFKGFGHERERVKISSSEWKCQRCGAINAGYVGTCGCGWDKSGNVSDKDSGDSQTERIRQSQPLDAQAMQSDVQTEQSRMLYCTSCGKQMAADSRFCRYCGTQVEKT